MLCSQNRLNSIQNDFLLSRNARIVVSPTVTIVDTCYSTIHVTYYSLQFSLKKLKAARVFSHFLCYGLFWPF